MCDTQLFAKYMLGRLNSGHICISTLSLIGCFWLSQGVYSEYTFGFPPKVGLTVRYVKLFLHWVFQKLLQYEDMGAEKARN